MKLEALERKFEAARLKAQVLEMMVLHQTDSLYREKEIYTDLEKVCELIELLELSAS